MESKHIVRRWKYLKVLHMNVSVQTLHIHYTNSIIHQADLMFIHVLNI